LCATLGTTCLWSGSPAWSVLLWVLEIHSSTYHHVNTVMSSCPAMLQLWLPYCNSYQLHAMACPTVGTLLSTTLMAGHKLANAWRCCLPLVKMRKAVSPLPLYGSREFQRKGFTFLPVIEQTTWLTLLSSIN